MKILVLGAVQRHPNLGVSALAEGSRAVLRRAFPGADVRFRSTGTQGDGPMNLTHTTPLLREMVENKRGLREWTRSFNLICDIRGGDSFTDIYTVKMLLKLSAFPFYAQRQGAPFVMLPQTIGPFEHRATRAVARTFLRRCAVVMARDPRSADFARELGRPADLTATDVVFAVDQPADVQSGAHDVVLNASGLLWQENRHVDATLYRESLRQTIDALLEQGRSVTVLAHVVGKGETGADNDRTALAGLREIYGDRVAYLVPESLAEVRRALAAASVVIGARMHACLNALSVGTPAIPHAYSRKFAPLLDELGWTHTVDLVTAPSAQSVVDQTLKLVAALDRADVEPVVTQAHARIDTVVEALRSLEVTSSRR
ncbi:MAG: polysaccharide pyruvyl transferase family protein [Micrococcus sp.]|nr:polysaccharide pyruvyl transferase family protein [Micrococcus sp.]